MNIWAIGDLHLSLNHQGELLKPMALFGQNWENHHQKIADHWKSLVSHDDVVLIPGDISWAMKLSDLEYDLQYLGALPAKKVLLRGNHDYWWTSARKMREAFPQSVTFIQNDSFKVAEGLYVCGTRGWSVPGENNYTLDDERIYRREVMRLRLSLESVADRQAEIMVMMHFPPTNMIYEKSGFIELFEEFGVRTCLYGHLHDASIRQQLPAEKWGIEFRLVSADALDFVPYLVREI